MKNPILNYLSSLLDEHNCVVLPDFGGFVANYQSARIDSNTNTFYPAQKDIVFNVSLKNNDGLLANEIAIREGISYKKAQKNVATLVEDLKDYLSLHKKIFIQDVGTLLLSTENKILFVQSTNKNHLLHSYGFDAFHLKPIQRTSVQDKIEEKIIAIDKKQTPSDKKSWLKVAAIAIPLIGLSLIGINKQQQIKTTYAELIPISNNTTVEHIESYHSVDIFLERPALDISDAISKIHQQKNQVTDQQTKIVEEPQFYIIAGAFTSIDNAEKLVRRLKSWRFKDARIVGQNKNGLYRVSYAEFDKPYEALITLEKIREMNPSAWLLRN